MDTPFYRTRMGQKFYESTLPDLVREVKRLADAAERIAAVLETDAETAAKQPPESDDANPSSAPTPG